MSKSKMTQCYDNTDFLAKEWHDKIISLFHKEAIKEKQPFTIEQIRVKIAKKFPYEPHDLRAYGYVVRCLSKAGAIKKTGDFMPARSSHGSPKPLWIAL